MLPSHHHPIGSAVLVILSADTFKIEVLGPGTLHTFGHGGNETCPIIKLASGQFIPGCACWWGSPETMEIKLQTQFPFAQRVGVEPPASICLSPDDPAFPQSSPEDDIMDVTPKYTTTYLQ